VFQSIEQDALGMTLLSGIHEYPGFTLFVLAQVLAPKQQPERRFQEQIS
jgi:hypothetical protein